MRHIKSFGVELEGLFNTSAQARPFNGRGEVYDRVSVIRYVHGDGSVTGSFPDPTSTSGHTLHATESHYDDADYDDDGWNDGPWDDGDIDNSGYLYGNTCCCGYHRCTRCYPNGYTSREAYMQRVGGSTTRLNGRMPNYRCAEWSSPPIFLDTFPQWREILPEWWPTSVNSTCGMHCHLGLRTSRDYARLLDLGFRFTVELVEELTRQFQSGIFSTWPEAEIALRRFRHNNYCHVPEDTNFHMRQFMTADDRYTAVNFSAFRSHGTVELRILPSILHADRGITLIDHALNFTNDYLATKGRALVRVERKPIVVTCEDDLVLTALSL